MWINWQSTFFNPVWSWWGRCDTYMRRQLPIKYHISYIDDGLWKSLNHGKIFRSLLVFALLHDLDRAPINNVKKKDSNLCKVSGSNAIKFCSCLFTVPTKLIFFPFPFFYRHIISICNIFLQHVGLLYSWPTDYAKSVSRSILKVSDSSQLSRSYLYIWWLSWLLLNFNDSGIYSILSQKHCIQLYWVLCTCLVLKKR